MGLMAGRAANRAGARQQYRTMARMQRRRTSMQDRMGARQDFQPAGEEEYAATPAAPAEPDYVSELERLAQLRDQGVITAEDFDAKKRQLLGL
jgi:membrane protease subunit (stomatin/prohibitin family)